MNIILAKFKKNLFFLYNFFLIFIISCFFFLIADFFFGKIIVNQYLNTIKDSATYHKKQRIRHDFFHHSFAPNIDYKKTGWGPLTYRLCTDKNGFKNKCNSSDKDKYKIVFIGDSFVEGIGLSYENTFSSIISEKLKISVANMGVSSYSTKIYLSKIKYFLDKGLKFDHVVVYIDISDLIDDVNYFEIKKNFKVRDQDLGKKIEWFVNAKFPVLDQAIFYFFKTKKKVYGYDVNTTINKNINFDVKPTYRKDYDLRSVWTYAETDIVNGYKLTVSKGLQEQLNVMNTLHKMLKEKNINLSVAVYPWPQTILYDKPFNIHVKTWKKFCEDVKCANFINHYDLFMSEKDDIKKKIYKINSYYLSGDIHFNSSGNNMIANDFIKKFKNY